MPAPAPVAAEPGFAPLAFPVGAGPGALAWEAEKSPRIFIWPQIPRGPGQRPGPVASAGARGHGHDRACRPRRPRARSRDRSRDRPRHPRRLSRLHRRLQGLEHRCLRRAAFRSATRWRRSLGQLPQPRAQPQGAARNRCRADRAFAPLLPALRGCALRHRPPHRDPPQARREWHRAGRCGRLHRLRALPPVRSGQYASTGSGRRRLAGARPVRAPTAPAERSGLPSPPPRLLSPSRRSSRQRPGRGGSCGSAASAPGPPKR